MNIEGSQFDIFDAAKAVVVLGSLTGASYLLNSYLHPYKHREASRPDPRNLYPTIEYPEPQLANAPRPVHWVTAGMSQTGKAALG